MAVITTIRSAFGFLTRLPVGPWPLQNALNEWLGDNVFKLNYFFQKACF